MTFSKGLEADGSSCYKCRDLIRTKGRAAAKADHERCHGWTHCGPGCCGACPHCGDDGWSEDDYEKSRFSKGYCDYGHEADDVRRLPMGSQGAGVFVCKACHTQETGPTPPSRRQWANLKPQSEDDTQPCRCTHPKSLHGPWNGDASGQTHRCRGCFREDYDSSARKDRNMTSYHHFTEGGDTVPDKLPDDIRNMKSRVIFKAGAFDASKYCAQCGHQQTHRGHSATNAASGWYVPCTTPGCNCNGGNVPRPSATHGHTDVDGNEYEHFHDIGNPDHEHADSHIAVPDRLPDDIRNMKSHVIFKSTFEYGGARCPKCGGDGGKGLTETNCVECDHKFNPMTGQSIRPSIPCIACGGFHPLPADKPDVGNEGYVYTKCPPFPKKRVLGVPKVKAPAAEKIRIPNKLPKEIRNMKSRRSALIFKAEDQYERCGQEGCGHARGNHGAGQCYECFKNNGSANPMISHNFKSQPGFTGSGTRRAGTETNSVPASRVHVAHPNKTELHVHNENFLTGISALREKYHGTANDKTLKSKGIYDPRPKKKLKTFAVGGKGAVTPNKKVRTQAVPFDDMRDNGNKKDRGDLSFKPKADGKVRKSLKVYGS